MIKQKVSGVLKILLGLEVLWMAGCSSFAGKITPSPTLTTSGVPVLTATAPAASSFTGKIAFLWSETGNDIHIYVMNANSGQMTDVTPDNFRSISNLSWSPDGQSIAFDARKDRTLQLFKMKADGSGLTQLTSGERHASRPSWSPDGAHILFMSSDKDILDDSGLPATQTYIMNSDGSGVRRFTVDTRPDNASMSGSYRADGLIAISEPATKYASTNYIVNSEGVIQKQFPEFWSTSPIVWSPDGKYVVHYGDRRIPNECLGFVLMKFDRSDRVCLLTDEAVASQISGEVSWSLDGEYIIFSATLDDDTDIYAIKADDTGLTQLTNLPGSEGGAVWWMPSQ